jgi:YgiT-type zinc finger domain-containing protein
MKFSSKNIKCDFCENGVTESRLISKTFRRFGNEFLLENIKAEVCTNCGEAYLDSKTIKEIDSKIEQDLLLIAA